MKTRIAIAAAVIAAAGCTSAPDYPLKGSDGHEYRLIRNGTETPGQVGEAALYQRKGSTNTYLRTLVGDFVKTL